MQELLQKRVELLKEKEELLKERQMIANQSKQGAAPTAQRPKEPAVAPSKRAEDLMSAVNGNIFQGGDTGAKKTSNKKKEDDEAGFFGREFPFYPRSSENECRLSEGDAPDCLIFTN